MPGNTTQAVYGKIAIQQRHSRVCSRHSSEKLKALSSLLKIRMHFGRLASK